MVYFCATTIFASCESKEHGVCTLKRPIKNSEKLTMTAELIQDNIRDVYVQLYKDTKFAIKNFGNIVICESTIPSASFNVIFNYATSNLAKDNLSQALAYAATKSYPFLVLQTPEETSSGQSNNATASEQDISAIAKKYGFQKISIATRVALDHDDINFTVDDKDSIKRVNNEEMFVDWCAIGDEAFALPPGSVYACHAPVVRLLLSKDYPIKLFLAYDKNLSPVGASLLYLPIEDNKVAGHYFWGVKADHRKQGIMTNLVKNMVLIAKEHGYASSVAQCFDTSLSLAERLGFKKYGYLDLYCNVKEEAH